MIEINILDPELKIEDKKETQDKSRQKKIESHKRRLRLQLINIHGELVDVER